MKIFIGAPLRSRLCPHLEDPHSGVLIPLGVCPRGAGNRGLLGGVFCQRELNLKCGAGAEARSAGTGFIPPAGVGTKLYFMLGRRLVAPWQ